MSDRAKDPKLIIAAFIGGVVITLSLTVVAMIGNSRPWGCTFLWQACLLQTVVHTPDNPVHEASPIDLFAFLLGVVLGVPIYGALSYACLVSWQKPVQVDRN